ncbi:transcription antitermination factor NusB [Mycoplasmopsis primatum]|uniref:transcription antitermination factor NusB n=1 Tax=Mycoplasmopsis primatum TaxID=55604 RepID=UPI000494E0F8|nr:transcription antitermination factor NusB [Mycoplasmopsis primatum]
MKLRREFRTGIINIIYKYELLALTLNPSVIFENESDLNSDQFNQLELIAKNYDYYKKIIIKFLNNNNWDKISPLIRAILINASHELMTIDPKIVINEAIEITKSFFDTEANLYKFVNAILENIYKYYVINEAISH